MTAREHILTYTGLIGCEGPQFLHHSARGSDSHGHESQTDRQKRDSTMHQNVRSPAFLGLGIQVLSCISGYVSTMEPAYMLARR